MHFLFPLVFSTLPSFPPPPLSQSNSEVTVHENQALIRFKAGGGAPAMTAGGRLFFFKRLVAPSSHPGTRVEKHERAPRVRLSDRFRADKARANRHARVSPSHESLSRGVSERRRKITQFVSFLSLSVFSLNY